MNILHHLLGIFYPELCVGCDNQLTPNEEILCTFCRHDLPIINFTDYTNNKITQTFYGRIPIEKANALLYFRQESSTKKLIHQLKYKGNEQIGVFLGNWLGQKLVDEKEFSEIDCIIPVPLHSKKIKKRGYNQLTKFGEQLSLYLKKPIINDVLIKTSSSQTQTFKSRFERFRSIDSTFLLKNAASIQNKHILLIDDVLTTGATLEACAKELLKATNTKISTLTMAYTE
ncbi:ComF family protein [Polaribacter sp. WD7]|uniref:ComF family protein n=1 Tax=Polaribacter sp. WD7 TaxID=2269061 RepID=UPI000DF3FC83|nr:phosphoribosyltransferase family protein [Polaribacter sp. WD7]RCS27756.1 ComF family protein [Polaribacter sp. WD7]